MPTNAQPSSSSTPHVRPGVNPQSVQAISRRLEIVGQGHLLRFYDQLSESARRSLLGQIAELDLEGLPRLIEDYVFKKPAFELPLEIQPAPYYARDHKNPSRKWTPEQYRAVGQKLLRDGRVAAFVVAGGQGSRLGYEGPKGCYPAGAVTDKPLFAIFADAILGAKDRYGVDVPWYVMTSPLNHQSTVEFFEANRFFGLARQNVMFFPQGVMPSLDIKTGKVLLAARDQVATNPDGHGGSLKALHASGAIADMRRRGIDTISYFQVDNPIVNLLDPVFLGLHVSAPDSSGHMSSKTVAKIDAAEKVGLFCMAGAGPRKGRIEVVEYSDMPRPLMEERLPGGGGLRFNAGSIAVHVIGVGFVEKLNTDSGFSLPYHRAEKKVQCIDPNSGEAISPAANNGVKLERFVFDALPLCDKSIVCETDRIEEFAPIKNADEPGKVAPDSPSSSRQIQTIRAARWLESLGTAVPKKPDGTPDCVLEISPRTATTATELTAALGSRLPKAIERGQRLAL